MSNVNSVTEVPNIVFSRRVLNVPCDSPRGRLIFATPAAAAAAAGNDSSRHHQRNHRGRCSTGCLRAKGSGVPKKCPKPEGPPTLRRTPPFSGTLSGTLPGQSGPKGPREPCSWSAGSQHWHLVESQFLVPSSRPAMTSFLHSTP